MTLVGNNYNIADAYPRDDTMDISSLISYRVTKKITPKTGKKNPRFPERGERETPLFPSNSTPKPDQKKPRI